MVETTSLVVAGKKLSVPRLLKRLLQIALAVALTAGVFFVVIVGNGFLVGRATSFQAGISKMSARASRLWRVCCADALVGIAARRKHHVCRRQQRSVADDQFA
jgi:hypothetical protein